MKEKWLEFLTEKKKSFFFLNQYIFKYFLKFIALAKMSNAMLNSPVSLDIIALT